MTSFISGTVSARAIWLDIKIGLISGTVCVRTILLDIIITISGTVCAWIILLDRTVLNLELSVHELSC